MKIIERDGRAREAIEVICKHCGNIFLKRQSFTKICKNHYCSTLCASLGQRKRITLQCSNCGKEFQRPQSHLKKVRNNYYFCSRKCKDTAQRIGGIKEICPPQYGTGHSKYRSRAFRMLPNMCSICGYNEYTEVLQVHHIDKDRSNGNIENLVILCSNHHIAVTRGIIDHTGKRII